MIDRIILVFLCCGEVFLVAMLVVLLRGIIAEWLAGRLWKKN